MGQGEGPTTDKMGAYISALAFLLNAPLPSHQPSPSVQLSASTLHPNSIAGPHNAADIGIHSPMALAPFDGL
jgi:hypothetical protein